jgi:hypothetical protein
VTARLIKTPFQNVAELSDGSRTKIGFALREDRRALRQRYGALPKPLYEELSALAATIGRSGSLNFPVSIQFESSLASMAGIAPDEAAAAVATEALMLRTELEQRGLSVTATAKYLPILYVEGAPQAILELAMDGRIVDIIDARRQEPEEFAVTAPVPHHDIPPTFNQPDPPPSGKYATGQKVGLIEVAQKSVDRSGKTFYCSLFDKHEAFSRATPDPANGLRVTYQQPARTPCGVSSTDCATASCSRCVEAGLKKPKTGVCTTRHGTGVATVMTATRNGLPYGSAEAQFFYPNGEDPCDGGSGFTNSLEYLRSKGVKTVNISTGCGNVSENQYARTYDMLIMRAAGNSAPDQRACEFSPNVVCVGGTNPSHGRSCFSAYKNPADLDREEPDLMALAGDRDAATCSSATETVEFAGLNYATHWDSDYGTSFAAPTVTSIALLLREACAWRFPDMHHLILRAILRTAAYKQNPHGTRYSTPNNFVSDGQDGAGFLSAEKAKPFCDPGMRSNSGLANPDLDNGDGSTFEGNDEYEIGNGSEGLTAGPPLAPSAYTSGNDGSRVWQVISNLGWLTTGQRVRATMSWDACTSDPQKPLLDYDLFLFRNDAGGGGNYAGGFAFASQSISDVEEGFDFGINTDGEYILMAGWEPQSGCNNGAEEPFGWAWAVL